MVLSKIGYLLIGYNVFRARNDGRSVKKLPETKKSPATAEMSTNYLKQKKSPVIVHEAVILKTTASNQ